MINISLNIDYFFIKVMFLFFFLIEMFVHVCILDVYLPKGLLIYKGKIRK